MSFFDLRQWIESLVPWWVPFAIPITGIAIMSIMWVIESIKTRSKKQ